jgi:hypothetical protein
MRLTILWSEQLAHDFDSFDSSALEQRSVMYSSSVPSPIVQINQQEASDHAANYSLVREISP